MQKQKPYLHHLTSSEDLVTTYEAVRAGFVALALEKNRRATPLVAQARALKASASRAKTPADLLNIEDIHPALLTAAGVSDKAAGHLQPSTLTVAGQSYQWLHSANKTWAQMARDDSDIKLTAFGGTF